MHTNVEEEWREVPFITGLRISSEGRVMTQRKGGTMSAPYKPNQDKNSGYRYVCTKRLANLMLTVFVRPPKDGETADHIAKYDGDWRKERGDDRLVNLRWLNKSDQLRNQCKHKAKRSGKAVWLRRPDWPACRPSLVFASGTAAAKELNLSSGALSDCANRKRGKKCHRGWLIERVPPVEQQDDLMDGDVKEMWMDATPRLRISSFGRAQCMHTLGNGWGYRFTPMPTAGEPYAKVYSTPVHLIVYKTFHGAIPEGYTVDHIDQNKCNNRLANLRAATHTIQNYNRVVAQTGHAIQSFAIRGKPVNAPENAWQTFVSQNEAARILTSTQGQCFAQGSISKVVLGHMKSTSGWHFQFVDNAIHTCFAHTCSYAS